MTTQPTDPTCPDCGHTHAGPALAGICVGCPCPTRPEPTAVTTQPEPTQPTGCCTSCDGTGRNDDPDTNGMCPDCRGTGHTHEPDPTCELTSQLADVLAEAADDHGTHDHHGQAAEVLAWLDERHYLAVDPIVTRHATGYLDVDWPDGGRTARIARDLLDEITGQLNELADLRQELEDQRAWADSLGELIPESYDCDDAMEAIVTRYLTNVTAELASLRALLGLQPGQTLCGATADPKDFLGWLNSECVCLRPAGHTHTSGVPTRHRGLCGSWTA